MNSEELQLEPVNDTLNPDPPRFGMPWWAILIIVTVSVPVFFVPGCKVLGALLCPTALGFGWWLCKDDPKEPQLIVNDLLLPSEFGPGK